jgi:hypothetical protein
MRPLNKFLVGVDRVAVAGDPGEQHDVGFGDGLGEGRCHADREVFDVVTVEIIHGQVSGIS